MDALRELFTTTVGLLSLGVIVVVIGMGIGSWVWFNKQIDDEASGRGK